MTRLSSILASSSQTSSCGSSVQITPTLTTSMSSNCQQQSPSTLTDSTTSSATKPNTIFGSRSLWGLKDNLLSGLSSRLEAFQSSFTDNGTNHDPSKGLNNNSPAGSTSGSPCTNKQRRGPKIRSIFGQPEMVSIPNVQSSPMQRSKDTSMDSLDTLDSGQSMGGSSCVSVAELRSLELHDTLKPYRTGESIGIGSGQETSLESSEAEDEINTERMVLMVPRKKGDLNLHSLHSNCPLSDPNSSIKFSVQSWASNCTTYDNQPEDEEEVRRFMENFVDKIFSDSSSITLQEKALFGAYARTGKGRLLFSRFINEKRVYDKHVSESTFYSLVQYFAIILFECSESDDFSPAKTILNMCFTFYYEASGLVANSNSNQQQRKSSISRGNSIGNRQYLYQYLKEQPIWRSHRFWSAAFFDSVICEKAKSPIHERSSRDITQNERDEEAQLQENTVFGQLGAFTYYMKEFGLPEKFCLEFLNKQSAIGNLSEDQIFTLRQNVASLYYQ
ncbi:uncharacterized protein KIAA0513 isoform X2 [Tetranychus urticae]|uniref:SBF1/SBF2 domain-containing protein n=2 Tax=Tetranychus urticae TaxID=32264 RepID=T1KV65_TETUR|nr:uncharacterized protein KIAA0513 isoform X2 [Tetranychus urticae]